MESLPLCGLGANPELGSCAALPSCGSPDSGLRVPAKPHSTAACCPLPGASSGDSNGQCGLADEHCLPVPSGWPGEVVCCQPAPPGAAASTGTAHQPARIHQPHNLWQPGHLLGAKATEPTAGGAPGAPGHAGWKWQGSGVFSRELQPCWPKPAWLPWVAYALPGSPLPPTKTSAGAACKSCPPASIALLHRGRAQQWWQGLLGTLSGSWAESKAFLCTGKGAGGLHAGEHRRHLWEGDCWPGGVTSTHRDMHR